MSTTSSSSSSRVEPLDESETSTDLPVSGDKETLPQVTVVHKIDPDHGFDREELDYEDLEGIGIILTNEPAPAVSPRDWKLAVKKFFLPDKGRETQYFVGIVVDSLLFITWLILIFTLLDNETRNSLWYMPLLGICGGTVAMATPAGGGVFYFPALTILKVPPNEVVAFNFGAQTIGMGIFGTFNWIRKSRSNVIPWLVTWVVLWGWVGSTMSLFAFPISDDMILRIIFAVFSFLLAVYVILGLFTGSLKSQAKEVSPRSWKNLAGLAMSGLLGGILLGWISVGIDVTIFFALTAVWGVDSRRATVTSVLVIGWTSLLPLLVHIFLLKDVPYPLWLMVTGGSIIGAKIGPLINKLLGKKVMLIIFVVILAAEVIRTIVELGILPYV